MGVKIMLSARSRRRKLLPNQKVFVCQLQLLAALLLVVQLLLDLSQVAVKCAKLPDIYWNSSNPIFRIDNTDHIFDVNKKQHEHDQVDLVCPTTTPATTTAQDDSEQRYIIYSVNKDEYDTCRLAAHSSSAKVVAVCDQPHGKQRPPVTVTFRSFTPQPNGLEFKAGRDYYFITALIGGDTPLDDRQRFSPCSELNMRVIFKVCCKASPQSPSGAGRRHQQGTAHHLQTTSKPLTANVITLRPSLATPVMQRSQNRLSTEHLSSTKPPLPITVLPIEVLQQHQQQDLAATATTTTSIEATTEESSIKRLVPFDPTAPPNALRSGDRWSPTPLPPTTLTKLKSAISGGRQPAPIGQQTRASLYVWPATTFKNGEQPMNDQQTTVLGADQNLAQGAQSSNAPAPATTQHTLLALMISLTLSIALLLHLQSRRT